MEQVWSENGAGTQWVQCRCGAGMVQVLIIIQYHEIL